MQKQLIARCSRHNIPLQKLGEDSYPTYCPKCANKRETVLPKSVVGRTRRGEQTLDGRVVRMAGAE